MKTLITFITISIFLLTSCSENESELSLNFKMQYDNEPLIILNDYIYPDGRAIRFTRVSFFISELTVRSTTDEIVVLDIDMINLSASHMDLEGAQEGISIEKEELEIEDIESVSFNLGLTEEQNSKIPADYSPENPLSNSAEYWPGWQSYVFAKIEGFIDMDNDGTAESTFAMHLGTDEIKRSIIITNDEDEDEIELDFSIDLQNIFSNNEIYDIVTTPNIDSPFHLDEANFLINNWKIELEKAVD